MSLFDCGLFENVLTNIHSGMSKKPVGAVATGTVFGTEVIPLSNLIKRPFKMQIPRNFCLYII